MIALVIVVLDEAMLLNPYYGTYAIDVAAILNTPDISVYCIIGLTKPM